MTTISFEPIWFSDVADWSVNQSINHDIKSVRANRSINQPIEPCWFWDVSDSADISINQSTDQPIISNIIWTLRDFNHGSIIQSNDRFIWLSDWMSSGCMSSASNHLIDWSINQSMNNHLLQRHLASGEWMICQPKSTNQSVNSCWKEPARNQSGIPSISQTINQPTSINDNHRKLIGVIIYRIDRLAINQPINLSENDHI